MSAIDVVPGSLWVGLRPSQTAAPPLGLSRRTPSPWAIDGATSTCSFPRVAGQNKRFLLAAPYHLACTLLNPHQRSRKVKCTDDYHPCGWPVGEKDLYAMMPEQGLSPCGRNCVEIGASKPAFEKHLTTLSRHF